MARNLKNISWMKDAACRDHNAKLFLSYDLSDINKAKAICNECSVKKVCLKTFFDIDCIAGGLTLLERMKAKRKRIENIDDIKRN